VTQTWQSMKGVLMHYLIQFSKFQIWIWDQRQWKNDIVLMYIFIHEFYQLIAWTTWEENNSSNHLVIMWTWPWIMWFLRWELVKNLCCMISRNNLLFTHCVRRVLKCFAWQKKDNIHAFQLAMKVSWPLTLHM
jgi:hypothetical protein